MKLIYFTVDEAAARLRLHRNTILAWIKDGRLRAVKPGKSYMIPRAALDELFAPTQVQNAA